MPVGCAKSILISFNLILWEEIPAKVRSPLLSGLLKDVWIEIFITPAGCSDAKTTAKWLAGGTLIVLGTWIFVDSSKIHLFHFVTSDDLNTDFGYYLAYILLSLGGIVLITGLFGCCGAVRENRCLLVSYFILLFLLMCIELTVSVITFIYKDHYLSGLEERLTVGLVNHYGYKNSNEKYLSFSEAVDFAQYKVEEPWQNPDVKDDLSCQDGSEKVHAAARHKEGCIREIETWFKKETAVLITVGISSAALQMIGMIFVICLCRSLDDSI